jgi:endonuclease/exonuclease/phosphatase family metal-dependent hydrolase
MVRIASFNVENLFQRPKAFNTADWSLGQPALEAYGEVNALFSNQVYSTADKLRMIDLLVALDIYSVNSAGAVRRKLTQAPRWAWLRKNRGAFDRQPADPAQSIEIIANGRNEWIGWVELAREPTNETGTRMTARVIQEVGADIIAIVEAEDRPSLVRFNHELLGGRYRHVMLVDGNDERGIDVGIMTGDQFEIESIRSNVDLQDATGPVFSRDCAQYEVRAPSGTVVHLLVNHFKSQSGGGGAKRRRQASQVRRIAEDLVAQGRHVIVLGDLNEGPAAADAPATNLSDLFATGGPLVDCYALPGFQVGSRPGTFDACGLRNRLDYILISHSLPPCFAGGAVFRKGLWGSRVTRPTAWETYPEMTDSSEQASDHSVVYIDLTI